LGLDSRCEIKGCLNFVFDAEKARFFVQIDTFLSAIAGLRLEKRENLGEKDSTLKHLFKS